MLELKQKFEENPLWFWQNGGLRALWWKQPYAGLMLDGKIETRVWKTDYRGWVLICSSMKPYSRDELIDMTHYWQFEDIQDVFGKYVELMGYAIAIGRLKDCRLMRPEDEEKTWCKYREPWIQRSEKTGKPRPMAIWCHEYEHVTAIEPFMLKGCQGWLHTSNVILEQIKFPNK